MTRVAQGSYKDQQAVVLETGEARAVLLPRWGAKLASFVHKGLGAEVLWQAAGDRYIPTKYGDIFETGEFSGFDEMFPTIARCFYESAPWAGVEVPDHGEVWTLPWEYALGPSRSRWG